MGKQYLVVKIAHQIGHVLSLVPLPGIFSQSAAEELVREITSAEPGSKLMIQEVGVA
ncbi:MAG TPA: hypothetical protein VE998_01470 [Terriglobales bacterium]|nr:hypothetical protein [Terriglobales bacterium]